MTENLDDAELLALQAERSKLLDDVTDLRDKLLAQEKAGCNQPAVVEKNLPYPEPDFDFMLSKKAFDAKKKCYEACGYILGITFKDLDRKRIGDDTYLYEAKVMARVLDFYLELTVKSKVDEEVDEILDITCHFTQLKPCYMLEVTPWVMRFTKAKQFSYLMNTLSHYGDQSIIRARILSKHQQKDYLTVQECIEDDGGIVVNIHAPIRGSQAAQVKYFKLCWQLQFTDATWSVEHVFIIEPLDAGEDLLEAIEPLLREFCKCGLKKNDLEKLWTKLCIAIENSETIDEFSSMPK